MFGKKKSFLSGEPAPNVAINLTALMDILSNLLFFLIASYAAQTSEVQVKDLALPASTSQTKIEKELTVSLTTKQLLVADVPIGNIQDGKIDGVADDREPIPQLLARLKAVKDAREAANQDDQPGADTILLLADKGTDSTQVSRVLKTAAAAGFVKARFGVIAQ